MPILPAMVGVGGRMRRLITFLMAAASLPAAAQTRVDLRTQSKSVDFTAASSTRPLKAGVTLPATCTVGEMFFKTDGPAGRNVYGCANADTWQLGAGEVTVESDGTAVGTQAVQNFIVGPGLVNAMTDTGTRINIQQNVDTAVVQTREAAQSGSALLCASAGGSGSAYTCSMSPTLTAYTPGMVLFLKPDVSSAGAGVTIDMDTLGPVPVRLADGVTDPTAAEIVAGRLYPIWYDGAFFRLLIPPMNVGFAVPSRPVCGGSLRGRLWQTFGGPGVKDEVAVCAKDAADAYQWRTLY
jgi:hypothetical protein